MVEILLLILKILGISILVILGLLLAIILIVLICPFTYKVWGSIHDEEKVVHARFSYLFGLLRGSFDYPEKGVFRVKLLFFTIFKLPDDNKKTDINNADVKESVAKESDNKDLDQQDPTVDGKVSLDVPDVKLEVEDARNSSLIVDLPATGKDGSETEYQAEYVNSHQLVSESTVTIESVEEYQFTEGSEGDIPLTENPSKASGDIEENDASEENQTKEKLTLGQRIENLKFTLKSKYDKIKSVYKDIDFYKRLITDEKTIQYIKKIWNRFGRIIKCLLPRKISGHIIMGMDAPDVTGDIYAAWSVLSTKNAFRKLYILPDFHEKRIEGDLKIKGHFCLIYILLQAIIVLIDRRLRILLRRVKYYKHPEKRKKRKRVEKS